MEATSNNLYLNITTPIFTKNSEVYLHVGNNCYGTAITVLPKTSKYANGLGRILYKEMWHGGSG